MSDFFRMLIYADIFLNFGNENQIRYQISPIPVPRLFSGTKFFRYRFLYHQKNEKFSVPVPMRYRYPLEIFKIPKFCQRKSVPVSNFSDTGSETFFRYQFFPIPIPIPQKRENSRYRYITLWEKSRTNATNVTMPLLRLAI